MVSPTISIPTGVVPPSQPMNLRPHASVTRTLWLTLRFTLGVE